MKASIIDRTKGPVEPWMAWTVYCAEIQRDAVPLFILNEAHQNYLIRYLTELKPCGIK